MNTTMETPEMMETQMDNEMSEVKTANLAGDMHTEDKTISKEDAIMGLIKNQMVDLQSNIDEANITFAKAYQNDKYSKATYEAEENCKMLNAQMSMLNRIVSAIDYMFSPIDSPMPV